MRQGGMKPKGHSSGTYWVRANAKTGGSKKKKNLKGNDDGVVDKWDNIEQNTLFWSRIGGVVIAIVIIVIALIAS